jgi:hypothetical protein
MFFVDRSHAHSQALDEATLAAYVAVLLCRIAALFAVCALDFAKLDFTAMPKKTSTSVAIKAAIPIALRFVHLAYLTQATVRLILKTGLLLAAAARFGQTKRSVAVQR